MTISALPNYYQLNNTGSSTAAGTGTTTNSSPLLSPTQSLINDLENADSVNSSSDGSASNDAYSLNLSSAAQELLGAGSSSSSSSSNNFTLTTAQQEKITSILKQYENSPLTQATYEQIQQALQSAGLSPDQLIANDLSTSFSPVDSLISALNGNYSTTSASTSISNEQTKATNYMQAIVKEWQSLASASSSSASGSSSTIS